MPSLKNLVALRNLRVREIDAWSMPALSGLLRLEVLELNRSLLVTNESLVALIDLPALHTLKLGGCNVTDLSPLSHLPRLSTLQLEGCTKVLDLTPLSRLPALSTLSLKLSIVTDLAPLAALSLTQLSLQSCHDLSDAGLEHLRSLSSLHTLDVGGCRRITSLGLSSLSLLTGLKNLGLRETQLNDDTLGVLCQSLQLDSLQLGHCKITNEGLGCLTSQRSLRVLGLEFCQRITDLRPLAELTKMRKLVLEGCTGLSDQRLRPLSTLRHLQELDLTIQGLSEECLSVVPWASMRLLYVEFEMSDRGLKLLSPLAFLPHFSICKTVSDAGLRALSRLTKVQALDLSQCLQVSDKGLSTLASLVSLRTLNLKHVAVTDSSLKALSSLTLLTSLDLSGCDLITTGGLWALQTLEALRTLDLSGCTRVSLVLSDLPPLPALRQLGLRQVRIQKLRPQLLTQSLESVDLSWCSALSISDLRSMAGRSRLAVLRLSRCGSIRSSCLKQLSSLLSLRDLDLSHNAQVKAKHARALAALPLETLNLRDCASVGDDSLEPLSACSTLTNINVSDCDLITDAGLQCFRMHSLRKLDISSCDRVTPVGKVHFGPLQLRDLNCFGARRILPDCHASPANLHPTDMLRLAMLEFASKHPAEHWFYIEDVELLYKNCVALHIKGYAIPQLRTLVQLPFKDVHWGLLAFKFSSAVPNLHHRWYLFRDTADRVRVHARPLPSGQDLSFL
jgi:hypothetical protein